MELKHGAAREIALAFGVPPMLLGIPGDNTYANYREANLAFWRQTVLPLVGRFAASFSGWLGPAFGGSAGEGLKLSYDADAVDALGGGARGAVAARQRGGLHHAGREAAGGGVWSGGVGRGSREWGMGNGERQAGG